MLASPSPASFSDSEELEASSAVGSVFLVSSSGSSSILGLAILEDFTVSDTGYWEIAVSSDWS